MRINCVLALLLSAAAAPAFAHDTWLLPARARLQGGDTLVLELTSGMDFPRPGAPVKEERIVARGVRLSGAIRELKAEPRTKALALSAVLDKDGVALAWIATGPRSLELTPEEVVHYLEEVGAADTIGVEWKKSGKKVWRESYVKLAKTYVRVGDPSRDRSWDEPVGLALEMVPEADPTLLKVGDILPLRLLRNGAPIAGLAVGAVASGTKASIHKTDADGRVTVAVDRAGPWLLRATAIRRASGGEGGWESVFTTLTLDVPGPGGAKASESVH